MMTIDLPGLGPLRSSDPRAIAGAIATHNLLAEIGDLAYARETHPGHITSSGFVVSPDRSKTLLMHHRKLDRWVQPGGHCDGETDARAVALRELEEETGLTGFKMVSPDLFDIDVHEIPAYRDVPAHMHHDVRFLFEIDPDLPVPGNEESHAIAWVHMDDLERYTDLASVFVVRNARDWG